MVMPYGPYNGGSDRPCGQGRALLLDLVARIGAHKHQHCLQVSEGYVL